MTHRLSYLVLMSILVSLSGRSEWVSLKSGTSRAEAPRVTVLQDDLSSTVLKVDISGFEVNDFQADGRSYQSLSLLTDPVTNQPGSPELPYVAKMLAIPDRGGVTVEVIETGEIQKFGGYVPPPARAPWQESAPPPKYIENDAAYHSTLAYPESFVTSDDPAVFRDFRVVRIAVYPVHYVAETRELQVLSSITVRVRYGIGNEINPKTTMRRAIPLSFGAVYRNSLVNYQSVLDRDYSGLELGREVLLCIVPDTFATAFIPYAQWKHESGTYVVVTKFSQIGANSTNPDIIKNYIEQCYHLWPNPPTYILLVGDYGQVPIKPEPSQGFAVEDYFVEIDGNDVFPEMYIGRFTHDLNSVFGLQTIINKVIKYERTPYRANQDWFKHSVVCSNTVDPTQQATKRWVTTVMRDNGGFVVDTLLPIGSACPHNLTEVIAAINSGRGYLNYRGEGGSDGWWATCYPFNTSNMPSVNNGEMATFVTSIGCGVANFTAGNSFGETWMELGTPTATRGSCAFIGPTWGNTHAIYNNEIDKGLYVALLQEGLETPGQTLLRGKIRMYNTYGGSDPQVLWHFRTYTVLGDPSTHVWKDVPRKVNITYPSYIAIGYNQVQVTVVDSATHAPVVGAEICIAGDSVYVTGLTDASGVAIMSVTPPTIDTLTLLVRGVRVLPVEGTIGVISEQEYVAPFGDPVVTDLDGNLDGKANPNEHVQISYVLRNWGMQTANDVQATLSAPDTTYVTIVNAGPVTYGTLPPSGSSSGTGTPLQFYVKSNTPVGSVVTLQLNVTSSSHAWNYVRQQLIVGCNLQYVATVINDQGLPQSNNRLDPGETAIMYVSIVNDGDDVAPNVRGVLRSTSPYVTVRDSVGTFGTLPIGGNSTNTANYFVVTASDTCPAGSSAALSLSLNTENGNYAYSVVRGFSLTVGLPVGTDPTGPDAYGYYAYANDDSLYQEAPEFNWVEIRDVGTRVPYVSPGDFTVTASLPFAFKYYGRNYTNLRISSDGWMAFGSGTQTSYNNYPLPHSDNVANMVALFWDDLFEGSSNPTSKLFYYSDIANHRFVVEWDSVGHYSGTTLRETFQAVLLDPAYYPTPTGDGEILFQYRVVGMEVSCTTGIEDSSQTIGMQYLYNGDYAQTATNVRDRVAVRFTTRPPTVGQTNMTVSVLIEPGWNLVSNPVERPDSINGVRRLFLHSETDYAFKFEPGTGYVQRNVMDNGPGYWLKFPNGEVNPITGIRILSDSIDVSTGWNLIGSISSDVDTSMITTIPAGLRSSGYFGYAGGYGFVTMLSAGQGYWVKANGPGQFVLGQSFLKKGVAAYSSRGSEWEGLSSITIRDSKKGSQTLHFGSGLKDSLLLSMCVMPPLPPQGAFDARFETADGGTMVRTHPSEFSNAVEFPISIQSTAYPLTVSWKIIGGLSYELTDAVGGQRVPARVLSGTGSMKIGDAAVQKLLLLSTAADGLPSDYELSQNYPNPFNPTTVIKYALPVESRVLLKIYNLLGQEVCTIVNNDLQPPGYKSAQWEGKVVSGLQAASGVYFVRLDVRGTNGATFSQVRKMLLMK